MRRPPLLQTILACVLSFLLPFPASAAADPPVVASDAWVRAAPSVQMNTAVFMTLRNTSSADVVIVGVRTSAAKVAELHEMRDDNGVMRMRKTERMVVPANGTLTLRPGGLHVMLFQLTGPLEPGTNVTLVLTTSDGTAIDVVAPVRKLQ
jgi:hypothetical protein